MSTSLPRRVDMWHGVKPVVEKESVPIVLERGCSPPSKSKILPGDAVGDLAPGLVPRHVPEFNDKHLQF